MLISTGVLTLSQGCSPDSEFWKSTLTDWEMGVVLLVRDSWTFFENISGDVVLNRRQKLPQLLESLWAPV